MTGSAANVAALRDSAPVVVTFKKRGVAKGNIRKRPPTPVTSGSDASSDDSTDEAGRGIKRRKKNTGVVTASSANNNSSNSAEISATNFKADRNLPITSTNDATKHSNWFEEGSNGAPSSKSLPADREISETSQPFNGVYKGLANQSTFIQKNPDAPTRSVGPIKAPTNVRTTTVMDYSPDVCKDYRQTGFCGFGDNCKFLHDRSDYKQGWQLDREWEIATKGKKLGGTMIANANRNKAEDDEEDKDAMVDSIPFACIICKGPYKEPIVTRCGHYFCERCALGRYKKDPSCAACGSGTNGVFNTSKTLKKLLEKRREREAQNEDEDQDS